jgi:fimbrial chaperone protein
MHRSNSIILKSVLLLVLLQSFASNASLLISPMRVAINDRERSAEVILINSSNTTKTYRVGWVQSRALSGGGYQDLNEQESADFPTASQMMRMSPKQVTLAPEQRQVVKIAARRPKDLPNGEYRSHLKFTAIPTPGAKAVSGGPGMILNLMLSYSIPVILRQGATEVDVSIDEAKIIKSRVNDKIKYEIAVSMTRSGPSSAFGSIHAYWKPNDSNEETLIAVLNSVHFYSELRQNTSTVFWQQPETPPVNGKLRITYEGRKEYQGRIFAEKFLNL